MADKPTYSTAIAELRAGRRDRDEDMLQALVTAGALVALADGELAPVERGELLSFINRQGFIPTISQQDAAAAFDNRVRQLEDRYGANVILETLRPLAGLSLASVVVRTAERVAAADRKIHRGEQRALQVLRLVLKTLPSRY
jgi:tellurite resistance protein